MKEWQKIEKKWQKKWADAKIFQAEPSKKKKYFATFPYPYINCSPHVGHAYSVTRNDMMIRYYKMLGYNTLFPIGFHATGEPIVSVAKRLKKGDKTQFKALELSGIKKEDIKKFTDPLYTIKYFENEWKRDFKNYGLAVDWRRSFHTTNLNPEYSAFVTWHFNILKEKGLLVKGTHPVIYCPECKSPSGSHDRKEGENATINEFILLKFKLGNEYLIAATLRPETVFGQTNLWINPDVTYVKIKIGKETWLVSKESAKKLKWQKDNVKEIGKVKGKELLGKYVIAPMIKKKIIILPSKHCDPKVGTGIVTSVPSDAPFDYIALKELQDNEKLCKKYGLDYKIVKSIKIIPIINSQELGENAAVKVSNEMKITKLSQKDLLEKATKHVYKIGFHKGIMNKNCGKYAGKKVEHVKDKVRDEMIKKKEADILYETSEPVVCRCLTKTVIKMIKNQWFIKYSDEKWKKKTLKCLKEMSVLPEEARNVMKNMIIKMKDKACARKSGLGTPLPVDLTYNIESLSDSTIYMSYYIVQKYVYEKKISVKNMTKEFFDYIFLKKGTGKNTKLPKKLLDTIRKEFEYFYPVDLRNSGKDLLTHHLIFFLYNHVAVWPKKYWPKIIAANGWVTVNGEKMSKSKGNFIPLKIAIDKYGADACRLAFLDTGEGISDADFSTNAAINFNNKLVGIIENVKLIKKSWNKKKDVIDEWLLSKIQKRIKYTTLAISKLLNRTALKDSFHGLLSDIYYYNSKKENLNIETLNYAWNVFARLNVPFIPHTCEELNELLENKGFIHNLSFPKYDKKLVNNKAENEIEFLKNINRDINKIVELVGKKPTNILLFVSKKWKYDFFKEFKKTNKKMKSSKELIAHFMKKSEYRKLGKEIIKSIGALVKDPFKLPDKMSSQTVEYNVILNNKKFIENEFNAKVNVILGDKSSENKAVSALPGKPGIIIE